MQSWLLKLLIHSGIFTRILDKVSAKTTRIWFNFPCCLSAHFYFGFSCIKPFQSNFTPSFLAFASSPLQSPNTFITFLALCSDESFCFI